MFPLHFKALLALSIFCAPPSLIAQSCSFSRFDVSKGLTFPNRITQYGAIVGYAADPVGPPFGFVRLANGRIVRYSAPDSAGTVIADRNSHGVNVGWFIDGTVLHHHHGFVLYGSTFIQVDHPGSDYTSLRGINDAGSIVGDYLDPMTLNFIGFVLKDGSFQDIQYPGSPWTTPQSINESGVVSGFYSFDPTGMHSHGFLFSDGIFRTIDDPFADPRMGTVLAGNNSQGEVVGGYFKADAFPQAFIYAAGKFTKVSMPRAEFISVNGINKYGRITGSARFPDGSHGFIGHCKDLDDSEDVDATTKARQTPFRSVFLTRR